jgi:hypothetical protein
MPAPSELARIEELNAPLNTHKTPFNYPADKEGQLIQLLTELIKSGAKPMSDEDLENGMNVYVQVLEYDGEKNYGGHWFAAIPCRGSIIQTWLVEDEEVRGRVEEIEFLEADEGQAGEVTIYIKPLE